MAYKFTLVEPVTITKTNGKITSATCVVLCNKFDNAGEFVAKSRKEVTVIPEQLQAAGLPINEVGLKRYLVSLFTFVHNQKEIYDANIALIARDELIAVSHFISKNEISAISVNVPDEIIIPDVDTYAKRMITEVDQLANPTPVVELGGLKIMNTELEI